VLLKKAGKTRDLKKELTDITVWAGLFLGSLSDDRVGWQSKVHTALSAVEMLDAKTKHDDHTIAKLKLEESQLKLTAEP